MKFTIGDKFILKNIECRVAHIGNTGRAYLVPENEGDLYNNDYCLAGVVFAKLTTDGRDELGNKAVSIINQECGAV